MTIAPQGPSSPNDQRAAEAFARRDLRAWLLRPGSGRMLLGLDLAAVALVGAAYLQLGPPELLFHGVFLVLTIDAFAFGRRICYQRIVAASVALLGYVALPSLEQGVDPLDLTEWPLMFAIAILVAWMADRERTAVRRYAGLYRVARDRLVTAQEEERRRLSRDLHDGIGQTLTALTMALDAVPAATRREAPILAARARSLASDALAETRSVAERVRPPRLEARGLASAIHELAVGCGLPTRVDLERCAAVSLAADHTIEIFRIAQEAIGNAVRHAGASEIAVVGEQIGQTLRLTITDDGSGFASTTARGLGIDGMEERAALLGARLRISSEGKGGTTVELQMPLRDAETSGVPGSVMPVTGGRGGAA